MMTYINTLGRVAATCHERGYRVTDYDAAARKNWENCSSLSFPGNLASWRARGWLVLHVFSSGWTLKNAVDKIDKEAVESAIRDAKYVLFCILWRPPFSRFQAQGPKRR